MRKLLRDAPPSVYCAELSQPPEPDGAPELPDPTMDGVVRRVEGLGMTVKGSGDDSGFVDSYIALSSEAWVAEGAHGGSGAGGGFVRRPSPEHPNMKGVHLARKIRLSVKASNAPSGAISRPTLRFHAI